VELPTLVSADVPDGTKANDLRARGLRTVSATTLQHFFRPNAVFIPTKVGLEGRDFDRDDCTLLFVDGAYSHGEVYAKDAWQNGGEADFLQRCGDFFLPDGSDIPNGRAQLLPDACIVKISEREWWNDDVRRMTTRMFGVYVLDRRRHVHLCEICPSYELHFVETQYEETDEVAHDEDKRDELNQMILEGDGQTEPVVYFHRKDIEPMFRRGRRCRPGWLPTSEDGGGYRLRGLSAVTWDSVMDEVFELRCNSDL
jgi:hypothetical protein